MDLTEHEKIVLRALNEAFLDGEPKVSGRNLSRTISPDAKTGSLGGRIGTELARRGLAMRTGYPWSGPKESYYRITTAGRDVAARLQ